MKLEITFKSGAQVTVDVTEFKTSKTRISGEFVQLDWTTPRSWKRKLHHIDLTEVVCMVAVED